MDWWWTILLLVRPFSTDPADQWAERLAALDEHRAQAFAEADVARLDRVYADDAAARRQDASTIRQYARRDGRVVGARLRVLSCRVVRESPRTTVLDVVDVLAPSHVRWGDDTVTSLPSDLPTRHRVMLVRTADGWRIAGSLELPAGR